MKLLSTLVIALLPIFLFAGNFNVKLKVELVDHGPTVETKIKVLERNQEIMTKKLDDDGTSKIELEEGRLYDIWIIKSGYMPALIHNVHNEGDSKFKITLYKNDKKAMMDEKTFRGVHRYFDEVKAMEIPAELLSQGVKVTKEEDLSTEEKVNLKSVQKIGKSQEKAQSKIDKLVKKRSKLEESIEDVSADMASGSMETSEGDEKKLKYQKKIVKINKKLEKLYY